MNQNVKPTRSGKSFLRGTHIMAVLCLFIAVGTGAARWWILSVRAQAETPVLALNSLIRDARMYHGIDGGFPVDLADLQSKVWTPRGAPALQLSEQNRSFVAANYYYLYTATGPHESTFWAVPLGRLRSNFSTYYVKVRHAEAVPTVWQGPALDYEQVKLIRGVMQDVELIGLGMKLQESPQAAPPLIPPAPAQPAPAAPGSARPAQPPPANDSPFRFKM